MTVLRWLQTVSHDIIHSFDFPLRLLIFTYLSYGQERRSDLDNGNDNGNDVPHFGEKKYAKS